MLVKVNSKCASKLPPNLKRGINTIFNHFRDKPARDRGFSHELAGWVSALHQKTLSSTLYAKTLLRNKLVFF
jgi:hypothetical protein